MLNRTDYYKDLIKDKDVTDEERTKLVKENWCNVAEKYGDSPTATVRDMYARQNNTEVISKYIRPGNKVLDVGCGNGFATAEYAKEADYTVGVDYIPEFIRRAKELHKPLICAHKLAFEVGDIRYLDPIKDRYGTFDKVLSERTIINLASWEEQKGALHQLSNLVQTGGYLILLDVTNQGHHSVDKVRQHYGLDIIEKHWNNIYLDEVLLIAELAGEFQLVKKDSFSLYTLISKVIHPLIVAPQEPKFNSLINKLACELAREFTVEEHIGHTVLYVFKKETW